MTGMSQSKEARTLSRPLATPKESVRVGCWNVRTMFNGIPTKLVDMVKTMYKNCRCAVLDEQVRNRRWKWLGHVLRMPSDKNPKIALTWE